ncbi:MAG: zinc ABC transporter substrate-binding protein [Pseudomonadota bacterium]|nr:zinc ABC transporter substrate-binding protein [Pseudomonadota bacterium]MDP1906364.1 zinc ABC transporter substrate-binding protein [Pseudomonadota bacterium]MDP2351501.1 zinc ABC transporter substrate-binding protein [Pseudomonadota bacterium]
MFIRLFFLTLLLLANTAHATLNVLACEPEWAALTRELAGDLARVSSATTARQNPHHIEARPSLIARARNADLLVCTGADLEIGWLPLLTRESGNARIQPGQPGYFEAAAHVRLLEKSGIADRAQGDIHPGGNPHLHADPRNLLSVANALARRLADLDPANAAQYAARNQNFQKRMGAAIARWDQEAAPLRGAPVAVQHRSWSYLADWLGLNVVADLEPKPGIEPSVASLANLLQGLKARPARMILRTPYQSPKPAEWLAERAGIDAVELPYTVGGSARATDLFGLFDDTLAKLKGGLK